MRISDWSSDVCSSDLAGAYRHADVVRVGGDVEPRVLDGHYRVGHAVVDEGIHLLDVLRRDPLGGIEALHLSRDAGGEGRCVEMRDRADPGAAVDDAVPARRQAVADRGQDAETR